jgi:ferredoxin
MTKCQVTGTFTYVGDQCVGSQQCQNEAVYAFDTKEIGIVYRCEEHKHAVASHWKKMTAKEAVVYEVLVS